MTTSTSPGRLALALVAAVAMAGCGNPGAQVNNDPNETFARLMRLPDIDQAARQYQQLGTEITQALTAEMPALTWSQTGDEGRASCGFDYPGLDNVAAVRNVPDFIAPQALSDAQWERALVIVGQVARKQGFDATPQRLNDSPGDHDAAFHSVGDDGRITLGTAKHTVLGLDVGCHLTAAAKARGHL